MSLENDSKSLFSVFRFDPEAGTVLALPKGSTAAGTAWTRVPFGRKMASGTIAPQPSSFTGLPSDVTTGGALQWYVPGKPFLEFAIIQ